MDRTASKPIPKRILRHKIRPHKKGISLLDHPELVAFDDEMHKLEGELHSARRALYEYKNCPSVKAINLLEDPRLAALDEEMCKLVWVLYAGREAVLEHVNLLENPKLATLDEEMGKFVRVLHDGQEAVLEQVSRHTTTKQHTNLVVDPEELTKEEACYVLTKQEPNLTPKKDQQHDQKTYTSI